jgi:hypothetical protein
MRVGADFLPMGLANLVVAFVIYPNDTNAGELSAVRQPGANVVS